MGVAPMKCIVKTALALICVPAFANDAACYAIQNMDMKNQCLAMAKRQDSYCYSIRESDTKNLCLAQVKGQISYCYSIRSSDLKNQCLATAR